MAHWAPLRDRLGAMTYSVDRSCLSCGKRWTRLETIPAFACADELSFRDAVAAADDRAVDDHAAAVR